MTAIKDVIVEILTNDHPQYPMLRADEPARNAG
jgi:hypothetical protein